MLIAMTGVSGSMGSEALAQVMEQEGVRTRVLLTPRKGNDKLEKELVKQYGARIEILRGQVYDKKACEKLVSGADMLVNMAAVIPPRSDKDPKASYLCNYKGAVCLADAAANAAAQPKFIHISTVAVYGNRTLEHPWGRPGDPLLPAVYDHYALHKMMAERYVMERGLKNFAVLRQSAMLYDGIIFKNIHDGLLFHTTLNGPLEWVSARQRVSHPPYRRARACGRQRNFLERCLRHSGRGAKPLYGVRHLCRRLFAYGRLSEKIF